MKKMLMGLLLVALFSCENPSLDHTQTIKTYDYGQFQIIEIDGCEYVLSDVHYGNDICHKGNCKYCIERNNNGEK